MRHVDNDSLDTKWLLVPHLLTWYKLTIVRWYLCFGWTVSREIYATLLDTLWSTLYFTLCSALCSTLHFTYHTYLFVKPVFLSHVSCGGARRCLDSGTSRSLAEPPFDGGVYISIYLYFCIEVTGLSKYYTNLDKNTPFLALCEPVFWLFPLWILSLFRLTRTFRHALVRALAPGAVEQLNTSLYMCYWMFRIRWLAVNLMCSMRLNACITRRDASSHFWHVSHASSYGHLRPLMGG